MLQRELGRLIIIAAACLKDIRAELRWSEDLSIAKVGSVVIIIDEVKFEKTARHSALWAGLIIQDEV